ncbi:alkaline phosphatase D family protein [Ramlibacter sp.]|uniref:alkaline phosphatase D family protein n=1 Tax=Ramlibacter sp. TaxID=1917967 RepID=UPI002B5597C0|nr:alkaline phosphatase D family protein [Ramlibacter sp.]HWI80540.1 alkaline phosphatase D family protein [Ramlibacter sp.]
MTAPHDQPVFDPRRPPDGGRRRFVLGAAGAALTLGTGLAGCGGGDGHADEDRFGYGVASGDPLSDRVILWTRVNGMTGPVDVQWDVASDDRFASIVRSGTATTDASRDYTVKVDATGLQPGTVYHYRFRQGGEVSRTGRTKTLPVGSVQQVRLAVFSCAAYPLGQFHVYADAATRGDFDAGLFLGDYIYETGLSDAEQAAAKALGRKLDPQGELRGLADYRHRYAWYHTDSDLRAVRALMPIIAVWDDHEIANGTWRGGGGGETGPAFEARRAAAVQAFHEWLPTRTGADPLKIYRSFDFGNLASLHMLDARVIGRDAPISRDQYLAGAGAEPTRQILGQEQAAWLDARLQASTATWQVLGQQVLMGRMLVPLSIYDNFSEGAINEYLEALDAPEAGRTDRQKALIAQPRISLDLEYWDAFAAAREKLFTSARTLDKNLVVLSGDSHNAWASELKDGAGKSVGVEFAAPSVTSTGLEQEHRAISPPFLANALMRLIPDLKYAETSHRGYVIVTLTPAAATANWIFVDGVLENNYRVFPGANLRTLPGAANRTLAPA